MNTLGQDLVEQKQVALTHHLLVTKRETHIKDIKMHRESESDVGEGRMKVVFSKIREISWF